MTRQIEKFFCQCKIQLLTRCTHICYSCLCLFPIFNHTSSHIIRHLYQSCINSLAENSSLFTIYSPRTKELQGFLLTGAKGVPGAAELCDVRHLAWSAGPNRPRETLPLMHRLNHGKPSEARKWHILGRWAAEALMDITMAVAERIKMPWNAW